MMTISRQTWSEALDEVAEELLTSAGVSRPPVDSLELAGRLKITIAVDRSQQARGRHKRLSGQPSIFLRPEERPERLQWAAAHELGEVVAWQIFERAGAREEIPAELREETANRLASRLLLPSCWFLDDARRLRGDLLELKLLYSTASHELIAYRLLDLPVPTIVTVFDHGRITRRRGNQGAGPPCRVAELERACRQRIHLENRPAEMRQGDLTVQGWPIHEKGWKREILRATATGEDESDDGLS